MSLLGKLPLLLAGMAIGCGARALDPHDATGGGPIDLDGGPAGDAAPDVLDAQRIETIQPARCGDGILDSNEQCDDGNRASGDGCTSICQLECYALCGTCSTPTPCVSVPVCSDHHLSDGEACDDGNQISGDGCAGDCKAIEPGWRCPVVGRRCVPICGDGRVVGPEKCDDGNAIAGDGCSEICIVEPSGARCGDGFIQGAEECDNGADNNDAYYGGCTADCRFGGFCGDGMVNGMEQCDRGTALNTAGYGDKDGCSSGCFFPHFCGDAIVDPSEEQCDFGPNNGASGQACTSQCRIFIN
jgi:cysteine-rich repeat protein